MSASLGTKRARSATPPKAVVRAEEEDIIELPLMDPILAEKKALADKARLNPAMTFEYPLDVFQQTSIDHLEAGDSVLVSAHTSAGKTTVALYAIAKALRENKRVIFTSPIKALSNQKFQEFSKKFGSVGLMTGDTTIKADADCLVMTTEILRSMLYRGTDMLREVGCVIFDEVHYMRDKSRGVVWEETIIMLPEGCQYAFLSATIPNNTEFAKWVERIHPNTKCHVVHTNFRPVPLQHYLYPANADGIFLLVDEKEKFRDENLKKAMSAMTATPAEGEGGADKAAKGKGGFGKKGKDDKKAIMKIIRLVMDRQMYPVIVFSFSKKECEGNAAAMSKLNFNTPEEDALVEEVFKNAIENLGEEDQQLPAIEHLLPLLRKGVGIHHSGLLPILKEIVELLFQSGLVKVLFSTETFAMGLNMPARTVVFTALKKFDGDSNRFLTGGEYIQMSGRAGRRGLDRVGVVIAMIDEAVKPDVLKTMVSGGADVLNSSFHLTYNMILNLLRVEDINPTYVMMRSFAQFQRERTRPQLEDRLKLLTSQRDDITISDDQEKALLQYFRCKSQIQRKEEERKAIMRDPKYLAQYMVEGRFVHIIRASDKTDFNIGVVRSINKVMNTVNVSVICAKVDPAAPNSFTPRHVTDYDSETAALYTVPFTFDDVDTTGRHRCVKLTDQEIIQSISKMHRMIKDQSLPALPSLTAEEMGIADESFDKAGIQIEKLKTQLEKNTYYIAIEKQGLTAAENTDATSGTLQLSYSNFLKKREVDRELKETEVELSNVSRTVFVEELNQMKRVLRRMKFLDDDLVLQKARVACEITTTDENEILLTELLFRGVLSNLDARMVVSLLSCLVNVHPTPANFSLPEEFQGPLQELKKIVDEIATVSMESGLISGLAASSASKEKHDKDGKKAGVGNTGSEKILPSLMEVTYKWAEGTSFVDVIKLTTAYEGDIVRMMRRLEEMLRQLAGAAKSPALGNNELYEKFMEGIALIKRDIVFASSLYL